MAGAVWEMEYETLRVERVGSGVLHVEMTRPASLNAMNKTFFAEVDALFGALAGGHVSETQWVRAVVVSGAGRMFSAGLDLKQAASGAFRPQMGDGDEDEDDGDGAEEDVGRVGVRTVREIVVPWQRAFTRVAECPVPVIGAIHGGCIGGGVDLACACDIRLAAEDAWFAVAEVQIGIVADLGTLQRLPRVVGSASLVRELAFTGRKMGAEEALRVGLVSGLHPDKEGVVAAALEMAARIAALSPLVVAGTKDVINFSERVSVEEGLRYVATFNALATQSSDVVTSVIAQMSKKPALFSNL